MTPSSRFWGAAALMLAVAAGCKKKEEEQPPTAESAAAAPTPAPAPEPEPVPAASEAPPAEEPKTAEAPADSAGKTAQADAGTAKKPTVAASIRGCCNALSAAAKKGGLTANKYTSAAAVCAGLDKQVRQGAANPTAARTTLRAQLQGVPVPPGC